MKYIQLLFVCTLFIGSTAYAQTPDNVTRAFDHISPDELNQDDGAGPAADANTNENKVIATMRIYPNPAKGGASKVAIRNIGTEVKSIQVNIIDATGFTVTVRDIANPGVPFEFGLNEVSAVKPGLYTVQVVAGNHILTEQWVVE